jgi:hypothetical protein
MSALIVPWSLNNWCHAALERDMRDDVLANCSSQVERARTVKSFREARQKVCGELEVKVIAIHGLDRVMIWWLVEMTSS